MLSRAKNENNSTYFLLHNGGVQTHPWRRGTKKREETGKRGNGRKGREGKGAETEIHTDIETVSADCSAEFPNIKVTENE